MNMSQQQQQQEKGGSSSSSGDQLLSGLDGVDAKDFNAHLREARSTDLDDLDRKGCVSLGKDLKGNNVIVLITHLGLSKAEKPEANFRKMLLLFIRKAAEIVSGNYCVVYAHSGFDIMNQYPLIYKFYALLPRNYKKNLIKMYVIHPNVGIRMFFEFSRVFLSKKFYNKLALYETILDFQREIPPTQLVLPPKFLRKEDEDREIKYCGHLAPLQCSFEPTVGASKLLDICAAYLRERGALQMRGIFRVAGDEGELNLIKVRLQYANRTTSFHHQQHLQKNNSGSGSAIGIASYNNNINNQSSSSGDNSHGVRYTVNRYVNPTDDRIFLSENKLYLLVGDIDCLSRAQKSSAPSAAAVAETPVKGPSATGSAAEAAEDDNEHIPEHFRNSENLRGEQVAQLGAKASSSNAKALSGGRHGSVVSDMPTSSVSPGHGDMELPPEVPNSIVVVTNVNTVAQMFKMAISHLPEPLVSNAVYRELITLTRRFEPTGFNSEYETGVAKQLAAMPFQNLSTLVYVVRFLREVAIESATNAMDTSNLAIIFAPTVFRPDMVDPMKAVMEMRLSKIIMGHLLDRRAILQQAMHIFSSNGGDAAAEHNVKFIFENPIHQFDSELLGGELANKMNSEELRGITDAFSPRLMNRLATLSSSSRGARGSRNEATTADDATSDDAATDADAVAAVVPIGPVSPGASGSSDSGASRIRKQDSDDDDIALQLEQRVTFKDVDSDDDTTSAAGREAK